MYYSREAVGSYDDLAKLGERTNSKELASDFTLVERGQQRAEIREMSSTELKWVLEPIARGEVAGYSQDERKEAFRMLNGLERLESSHKLSVDRNLHKEFAAPEKLRTQIARGRDLTVERIRDQEKVKEHDRSRGRGR